MMNSKKLRARQKAMLAKRGKRPWDERHREDAARYIFRLRRLFQMGMTDEFIANALGLDVVFVSLLRSARHTRSPQRVTPVAS